MGLGELGGGGGVGRGEPPPLWDHRGTRGIIGTAPWYPRDLTMAPQGPPHGTPGTPHGAQGTLLGTPPWYPRDPHGNQGTSMVPQGPL